VWVTSTRGPDQGLPSDDDVTTRCSSSAIGFWCGGAIRRRVELAIRLYPRATARAAAPQASTD
jgi:hypothetical protein